MALKYQINTRFNININNNIHTYIPKYIYIYIYKHSLRWKVRSPTSIHDECKIRIGQG